MNSNVFIGNIPYEFKKRDMEVILADFTYESLNLIWDRETQKNKGYGFVAFQTEEDARRAVTFLCSQEHNGRKFRAEITTKKDFLNNRRTGSTETGGETTFPSQTKEEDQFQERRALVKAPSLPDKKGLAHFHNWQVGNHCLAKYSHDQRWYNAKIDEIIVQGATKRYLVTYVDFGNSEELPYEDLRSPDSNPDEEGHFANGSVTFQVGDICEGNYGNDKWYMCEIIEVVNGGESYKVTYTDYNKSDVLTPDRIRFPKFDSDTTDKDDPHSSYNQINTWKIDDECQLLMNGEWVDAIIDDASIKGNWFLVINNPKFPPKLPEPQIAAFLSLRKPLHVYTNWKIGDQCDAKFTGDGKDHKGVVVLVDESKQECMITFIDLQKVEHVPFKNMKPVGPQQKMLAHSAPSTPAGSRGSGISPSFSTPQANKHLSGLETNGDQKLDRTEVLNNINRKFNQLDMNRVAAFVPNRK